MNVPVGVAALILAPFLLSESLDRHGQGFDIPGAVLVTSGLSLLVLGITQGHGWGWTSRDARRLRRVRCASPRVRRVGAAREDPLVPFSIFRLQTLTAANIVGFILGTAMFSMFLMLTLYMQQVLGYSPLETGVGYLAVAGTAIIWANAAAAAVTRIGVKPALAFGMSMMTFGLLYFTQVSVSGSYWTDPSRASSSSGSACRSRSCPSRSPQSRGRSATRQVSRRASSTRPADRWRRGHRDPHDHRGLHDR